MNAMPLVRDCLKWSICMLPFAVFYWLIPFCGDRTIGNDYPRFSIQTQMETQYSIARGSFPLYAPGFAGGRSAAALTLGQTYHPLSHLAAHSPGYWNGSALEWNTFWRLLSLGLTHLVLFNLLRKLDLRADAAFIISFLTVYNQRMLDMFRYGASLESYTGFLLLCAAMAFFYIQPRRILGPLSLMGATYLVICAGHPQMAYFGFIGTGLIGLVTPAVVAAIKPDITLSWRKALAFYATVGLCIGGGVLLASAYMLPFYFEFLRDAPDRMGRTYAWSVEYCDTLRGELNSFFNPLRSDVHGAFGSSPLILVAVLAPLVALATRKGRTLMIALGLALIAVILCGVGNDTPVHHFFWEYFPLASSFRVPGRISMLLPPIFMFVLAWFFRAADDDTRKISIEPWLLLLAVAIFITGYVRLAAPGSTCCTPFKIQPYPGWVDTFIFSTGLGCLLLATIRASRFRFRMAAGWLLALGVVLQAVVQLRYGTWVTQRQPTPSLEEMNQAKYSSLAYLPSDPGYGLESRTAIKRGAQVSPWAAFYRTETNAPAGSAPASAGSGVIAIPRPGELGSPPARVQDAPEKDRVASTYSAFNRIMFQVEVHQPGFLVLSVPYSSQWQTSVDSRESAVRRTDRNEQAVWLAPGSHKVEFRFHSPSALAGMLISCVTALLIGLYCAWSCRPGWRRVTALIATILIPAGVFASWRHSLYHGENLRTKYVWVSE